MENADLSFCYLKIAGVCGWCLWKWILPGPLNPPVCESGVLICDTYLDGIYYIFFFIIWRRVSKRVRKVPAAPQVLGAIMMDLTSRHNVNQDSLHRSCFSEWATTLTFMRNTCNSYRDYSQAHFDCRTFTFKGALSTSTKVVLMLYLTDLNSSSTSARYY